MFTYFVFSNKSEIGASIQSNIQVEFNRRAIKIGQRNFAIMDEVFLLSCLLNEVHVLEPTVHLYYTV